MIEIANYFNQDSATECMAIKRLKEEATIDINIDRVYSHRELKTTFQKDPGMYMVKQCHKRGNKIRREIESKLEVSNIRYFGDKAVLYWGQPISRLINELIWLIDAISKEERYLKEKFPYTAELIDHRVRENVKGMKKIVAVIKCYYGMNHYREQEKDIN